MPHSHDRDGQMCVKHVVDHPMVSDTDAPGRLLTGQFARTMRSRVCRQLRDGREEAAARLLRQFLQLSCRGSGEVNAVSH